MEDNFSTDGGVEGGMVQAVMQVMGSDGERWGVMGRDGERWGEMGSGGERWGEMGSDGERWGAVGSGGERQMKLCSLACFSPPAVLPGS